MTDTTQPRHTDCRQCRQPIWKLLLHGEPKRLDPQPLTLTGEAAALIKGLRTYYVSPGGGTVYRRRANHISDGYPKYGHIYTDHECGHVWEDNLFTENTWGTSLIQERTKPHDLDAEPPF